MKKKFLSGFIALLMAIPAIGQVAVSSRGGHAENNNRIASFIQNLSTSKTATEDAGRFKADEIEGSMYYDENFNTGKVYIDDKPFATVPLRYNAFTDQIEIKRTGQSEAEALLQDSKVSCYLNNEKLSYMEYVNKKGDLEKGYLVSIWTGENYQLYERRAKAFKAGQVQKTSLHIPTPDKFVDRINYYVSKDGSTPTFMNPSKKGITPVFGADMEKEIRTYIKENKLDLGDKRDLQQVLVYANSITMN